MKYLFDIDNNNYIEMNFSMILHNQLLDGQDKFPDSDLRELSFNHYSHLPRILQAKEVVLWTLSYEHVIVTSGVLDMNGELTVQAKDGKYEGFELDSLL